MKSDTQFLGKKQRILPSFEFFVRNKINLGIDCMVRPIHIYLTVSKGFPKNV